VTDPLLQRIEAFHDLVPRANARTEKISPFTLFVPDSGFPYYARPTTGVRSSATQADIVAVLERQQALNIPQAPEWLHDVSPDVLSAADAAGLSVHRCPMMVLGTEPSPVTADPNIEVRIVGADEPDLLAATRVAVSIWLAVAALLAADARTSGIDTVFLSADSDDVARIYARAGFVRRGTSCIAEPSA